MGHVEDFARCYTDDGEHLATLEAPAILVVDMLNDFCHPDGCMFLPEGREIVGNIRALVDAARAQGVPVIYMNDRHRPDKPDREFEKRAPHCIEGTWGAEVVSEIAPKPCDWVIPKRRYSGFYQTDLDLVLRENAVRTCVVCGVVTNICVRSTVHDAFFRGYRVVVPVDCVRATSPREQESSLWDIKTHFGTIGTSGEIIALMQDGGQSTS